MEYEAECECGCNVKYTLDDIQEYPEIIDGQYSIIRFIRCHDCDVSIQVY